VENKFKTEEYSLRLIEDRRFIIPSYQRPYVWGNEQINKLITDFYEAFKRKDKKYYIGTILLYEHQNDGKKIFQLIDGQQRFTTIWLLAVAFKIMCVNSKIEGFLKIEDELRIDFAIRKQIKSYMLSLLEKPINGKNQYSDPEIESDEYLINIAKAVTSILGKINTYTNQKEFGDFIYENIHFVINTVPDNMNLNKLFSTINNSGIQLEHSDILKSLLIKKIKTGKSIYSRIWEACENMKNYFERNVKQLFPTEFDWSKISYDDLKEFKSEIKSFPDDEESAGDNAYTISDILNNDIIIGQDAINDEIQYEDQEDDTVVYCRSIITFPQLLIHAYRIFLKINEKSDFNCPFHSDKLLQIFDSLINENEHSIKNFFKCLWSVRWIFDKEIVKWIQVPGEKDEELFLTGISKKESYFSRTNKEKNEISMLQSMLYFTGNYNTQIWLTPYLKRLLDGENSLSCLESIDNILSLSLLTDKETSFSLTDKKHSLPETFNFENYLNESNGTSFRHYWFQKLEYILWKEFNRDPKREQNQKFSTYRITSKNSIEHVFPRNHEFKNKIIDEKKLNCFGNLALLNPSQNSSYSNQDVGKKKIDFDNKQTYDSLKLVYIYEDNDLPDFNEEKIDYHKDTMIIKIKNHYEDNNDWTCT